MFLLLLGLLGQRASELDLITFSVAAGPWSHGTASLIVGNPII
jgi:hypothetical protein